VAITGARLRPLEPVALLDDGPPPWPLEDRPMPLRLTDAEMDLLHRLALPTAPERRPEFLAAVAGEAAAPATGPRCERLAGETEGEGRATKLFGRQTAFT
jgi:hypothetical protein